MFGRLIPHISGNPVFALDARRLRRGQTVSNLKRWTLWLFLRTLVVIAGLWLFSLFGDSNYGYSYYSLIFNRLSILFYFSIGADILLDFTSMFAAITTMQRLDGTHLNLLRLSLLPEEHFMKAQHALTQIRAWRMMVIVASLRVIFVLLVLAMFFFHTAYDGRTMWVGFLEGFFQEPFIGLTFIVIFGIFAAIYLLEPWWRMKAVSAFGLMLSARRNLTGAVLACFGGLVAVWLTQAIIIFTIGFFIVNIGSAFSLNQDLALIYILLWDAFTAFVIYWYYRALQQMGINDAVKRAYSDL